MLSPLTLLQADNRLILFDQSDFGAKRGWYVAFENQGPDGTPLPVETLRLILAVGDGTQWRFAETKGFHLGQRLDIQAKIAPDSSTLNVDGKEVGRIDAKLLPAQGSLVVGRFPDWASAPATYRLSRGAFQTDVNGEISFDRHGIVSGGKWEGTFPTPALEAFERPMEQGRNYNVYLDRARLAFHVDILPPPTLGKGVVDAYNQVTEAHPNPVRSNEDLRAAIAEEAKRTKAWTLDPNLDPYGGLKTVAWRTKPTGYYRVAKHGAKWSLVSPLGHPLFYTGLCTLPATRWDVTPTTGREDLFAALPPSGEMWRKGAWGDDADYFSPVEWSLRRKYGEGWDAKARASTKARLAQWGFTGEGKWAEPLGGTPWIADLSASWPKLNRHLDPFDPAAKKAAQASLESQLKPMLKDPFLVGTSIGNEYDEIVTRDEVRAIMTGKDCPAKDALGTDLSDAGIEAARKKYARAYYGFLYRTVKAIDPNHLYFGFWISVGWWQDESDWDLIAPFCDVIGYDRYATSYSGMDDRQRRTDKPTLLGEFAYPAWYGGARGYGRYAASFVETDADSGAKYAETVLAAAKDPYCVGALWFQYRDEPITGRGPGKGRLAAQGEHYAFGFVDVNDRPKWALVARAREANRRVRE